MNFVELTDWNTQKPVLVNMALIKCISHKEHDKCSHLETCSGYYKVVETMDEIAAMIVVTRDYRTITESIVHD